MQDSFSIRGRSVSPIPFWTMEVSSGTVEESMTCSNPAENPGCPEPAVL